MSKPPGLWLGTTGSLNFVVINLVDAASGCDIGGAWRSLVPWDSFSRTSQMSSLLLWKVEAVVGYAQDSSLGSWLVLRRFE
jgi:hypothetical protein